jgi:16S rRNA C1402 (ribose-2'-O) methylase RsmI
MPNDNISVVPVSPTSCTPFTLEVMVFSPESGFKFQVLVERSCTKVTPEMPAMTKWKLVFDLYKKNAKGEFDLIVHVSYTAENPTQEKKLAATATNGINAKQSKQLITKVHPSVKKAENIQNLPPAKQEALKKEVKGGMSKAVDLTFD